MSTNTKLILYAIAILILGLIIGGLITYRYSNNRIEMAELKKNEAFRTIDSLKIVEKANKEATDKILYALDRNILNYKNNLNKRDESFKNDTTILSSNELIQRIRSKVNND